MEKYEVLINKILKYEDFAFECLEQPREYSPEIQKMIELAWEQGIRTLNNKYLYDGNVFSLMNYELKGDILHCLLQPSTYKAFYGTNVINCDQIEDKSQLTNALATCVVCLTKDDFVLVGKRNSLLAEDSEHWHIIGGTMEGLQFNGRFYPENPYDLILRELQEEVSVMLTDISSLYCTGLARGLHNHKPEFLFIADLNLDHVELLKKANDPRDGIIEHTEFRCIRLFEVFDFVRANRFSPIGELAIMHSETLL